MLRSRTPFFLLVAGLGLGVSLLLGLHLAAPTALSQQPGDGCRELMSQLEGKRFGPLHTPYPCTKFDVPTANSVLTGTATLTVRGKAAANCEPNRLGVPTTVLTVDIALGATASFQPAGFTAYDMGCYADWQTVWSLPRADNQPVVLRGRTTSRHGLPTIFTDHVEEPPAEITVVVDNVPPVVTLATPATAVGDRFSVFWFASDGAGIQRTTLEYAVGGGSFSPLDSVSCGAFVPPGSRDCGSAAIGPTSPVVVSPGQTLRFRARATDSNGLTSDYVTGQTTVVAGSQRVFLPIGATARP
jgi:hypothetical protein